MARVGMKHCPVKQLIRLAKIGFESPKETQLQTGFRSLEFVIGWTLGNELLDHLIYSIFDFSERVIGPRNDDKLELTHVFITVLKSKNIRSHLRIVDQRFC